MLALKHRLRFSREIMSKPWFEIDRLIKDQNGNHVIQKLIEKGFCDNIADINAEFRKGKKENALK